MIILYDFFILFIPCSLTKQINLLQFSSFHSDFPTFFKKEKNGEKLKVEKEEKLEEVTFDIIWRIGDQIYKL